LTENVVVLFDETTFQNITENQTNDATAYRLLSLFKTLSKYNTAPLRQKKSYLSKSLFKDV
jgi:hypothetical protein